jgi:tyrosyl-tRNA synthetase
MNSNLKYNFQTLKDAILFNVVEVLPTDPDQLDIEIKNLIDNANSSGEPIRHYIGFEVSGQIHIGGGLFPMLQIAKLQQAGVEIVLWIADYHTWLNKKLDGKMDTIKEIAREYFGPVLTKCLEVAGGDVSKVKILYNFDDYRVLKNNQSFWDYEFQVENQLTLSRVLRSMSIMGRDGGEDIGYQMTRYPGMQCADVFWLQTHICQGGLDQRKIYVSARDVAYQVDSNFQLKINNIAVKPITLMGPLLLGLLAPEIVEGKIQVTKMSKSKPDSAIWVHDSLEEISRKLKKAYCPMVNEGLSLEENQRIQEFNPILDWCKNMIYPAGRIIEVIRPEKFGGNKTYSNYNQLETDYMNNQLHPADLKNGVANSFAKWLEPIRFYINNNSDGFKKLINVISSLPKK